MWSFYDRMKTRCNGKKIRCLLPGGIIALGLLVRLAYLSFNVHAPDFASPVLDPQLNDYWARAMVTGNWTPPPHADNPEIRTTPYGRPPGYPWLLAGIYWLSGGSYLAPRLIQTAIGLLNVLLVYLLGKRLFGTLSGAVASLLMALFWAAVYFEEELNSPVWEVCFLLGMTLLLLRWDDTQSRLSLTAAGVLLGLGALMRPNLLLAGCFAMLWVVWRQRNRRAAFSLTATAVLLYMGAALLVIFPAVARNWVVSRQFVFISYYGGINAYIGNNPEAEGTSPEVPDLYEISGVEEWNCFNYPSIVRGLARHLNDSELTFSEANHYFYGRALAFWRERPLQAIQLTLRKAWLFWGPHEISDSKVVHLERRSSPVLSWLPRFTHILALALAGLAGWLFLKGGLRGPNRASVTLILCLTAGYFFSILPFFIAERYRFPVVPFLLPFAGYAVGLALTSIRAKRLFPVLAVSLTAAGAFLAFSFPLFPYQPDASTWQLHRGIAYAAQGETQPAERSLLAALREDPLNDEAHLQLGYIRARQGAHDEAMEHYRQALEANPNNIFACNNLGYEYYLKGDLAEAEKYYHRALERQPIFTLALNNLGNTLLDKGDAESALRCFEEVLRINPRDPFGRYNVGNAYLATEAYDKAVDAYRLAFESQPFNPNIANNLGLALARSGRLEDSIPWFEKALSLEPDYPLAHFNLGNVYGDLGKQEEACRHYEQVLAAWPKHAETLKRHASFCGNQPDVNASEVPPPPAPPTAAP